MSDHWDFFPCTIGEESASIFVDIGISHELPKPGVDKLLNIRLHLKKPSADGLSTAEEFDDLCALEDTIEETLKKYSVCYVGRITYGGHREYYYYSADYSFKEEILQLMQAYGYRFDTAETEDPTWSSYKEELYPTSQDWQIIKDRGVIENLKENGDECSEARPIDHFAYFSTNADALNFCENAFQLGFEAAREISTLEDGTFSVHLLKNDTPEYPFFSNITMSLLKLAQESNGHYDGWGCPVIAKV